MPSIVDSHRMLVHQPGKDSIFQVPDINDAKLPLILVDFLVDYIRHIIVLKTQVLLH